MTVNVADDSYVATYRCDDCGVEVTTGPVGAPDGWYILRESLADLAKPKHLCASCWDKRAGH